MLKCSQLAPLGNSNTSLRLRFELPYAFTNNSHTKSALRYPNPRDSRTSFNVTSCRVAKRRHVRLRLWCPRPCAHLAPECSSTTGALPGLSKHAFNLVPQIALRVEPTPVDLQAHAPHHRADNTLEIACVHKRTKHEYVSLYFVKHDESRLALGRRSFQHGLENLRTGLQRYYMSMMVC